jgi:hypothetical protein
MICARAAGSRRAFLRTGAKMLRAFVMPGLALDKPGHDDGEWST